MTKTELAEIDELLGVSEADLVTSGWATESTLKAGDFWTGPDGQHGVVPISFRPLHNQVVIRVLRDDALVTSLWIPESANNKKHSAIGIVIARGPGHRLRKRLRRGQYEEFGWIGGYREMGIEPGDYVVFARFSGERHTIDGESYLITPVEHVYAVLEGYEGDTEPARETQFSQDAYLDAKHGPQTARASVIGKHSSK